MKKRISLTLTAVALATLMLVGGTLAWFADSSTVSNKITTGSIDIKVEEPEYPGNDKPEVTNVTPGTVIPKDPTVFNIGKNSAYIRVKLTYDQSTLSEEKIASCLDFNVKDWTLVNGYYYYNSIVVAGDHTNPLFNAVTIQEGWDNDEMNAAMNIKVDANAIQSDNTVPADFTGNAAVKAFEKWVNN